MTEGVLCLSGLDDTRLQLTAKLFDGSNYSSWSRSARMAWGARLKIGFIEGNCKKPSEASPDFEKWQRCDYMVTCWLLTSMTQDIADNSTRDNYGGNLLSDLLNRMVPWCISYIEKGVI